MPNCRDCRGRQGRAQRMRRAAWGALRDDKAWLRRWEGKRRRAFDGGPIDHTKDPAAPWGHPARYGYLVPLSGKALEAYKEWKKRTNTAVPSDKERWVFEDWYISTIRQTIKNTASRKQAVEEMNRITKKGASVV